MVTPSVVPGLAHLVTTASLLLDPGIRPRAVSEMLEHSAVGIALDLYSHITPTYTSGRRSGSANTEAQVSTRSAAV